MHKLPSPSFERFDICPLSQAAILVLDFAVDLYRVRIEKGVNCIDAVFAAQILVCGCGIKCHECVAVPTK